MASHSLVQAQQTDDGRRPAASDGRVRAIETPEGYRFAADAAITAGIADAKADADVLLKSAIERAGALAAHRKPNLSAIKRALHAKALAGPATPTTPQNLAFATG